MTALSPLGRVWLTACVSFAITWLLPTAAAACTVCMGGQEEESRKAFVGTTAFLTFFPLLMIAVAVGVFLRRALRQEREQELARSEEPASAPRATAIR